MTAVTSSGKTRASTIRALRERPLPAPVLDFEAWLRAARPGDRCTYYSGYLSAARESAAVPSANAAWKAYESGAVRLTQQKLTNFLYCYIAEKI